MTSHEAWKTNFKKLEILHPSPSNTHSGQNRHKIGYPNKNYHKLLQFILMPTISARFNILESVKLSFITTDNIQLYCVWWVSSPYLYAVDMQYASPSDNPVTLSRS